MKTWLWNLWKMQGKWQNGELSVLLNLLFHCTHQTFINHRRLAALQIMHIFASFFTVSHPSPYRWITHGIFSIHCTKLTINVSRFHVSCIQEMDYRRISRVAGFSFSWIFETHRTMRKHDLIVCKLHLCPPKGPTNSAHMHTIVTATLQRQYLQTEPILWICLVQNYNSACGSMWLRNLVSDIKRGT
jgi:hypothetical protein